MKNKIILMLTLVLMLSCLFVISANAEVTTYDDAPERTVIEMNDDEYVVFSDGFSCPSYYIIPDQTQLIKTDYSYIEQKTGKAYTDADVVEMHVPTGITDMYKRFGEWAIFTSCTVVGVPATAKVNGQFGQKSIVTKVYLDDEITTIEKWDFAGTKTLEEIIISENSKLQVIKGGAFQYCNNLKYLYLPEGFKRFDNTEGTEPFANFVPNGTFGFLNSPNETTIPEVYFFPSTFEYTEGFLWGTHISNYAVVLPETVTAITGKYDIDATSVTCIVLLSDKVTQVNLYNASAGQLVYLPNMSSDDVNGTFFNGNSTAVVETVTDKTFTPTGRKGGMQYYYFGVDQKYIHSAWSNSLNQGGFSLPQSIPTDKHLNAYFDVVVADCENDASSAVRCVCGYEISKNVEEGTALGHEFDVAKGAVDLGIVYAEGFFKSGAHDIDCARCDKVQNNTVKPIFHWVGYSAKTFGDEKAFGQQYVINQKELGDYKAYVESQGKTFSYGVVAAGARSAGQPLSVVGNEVVNKEGAQSICFDQLSYDAFFMNISGIDAGSLDVALMCCAYVRVGDEIVYLDNNQTVDTVELTSFAKIDAIVNPKEDIA